MEERSALRATSVSAQIASLKWTRPEYVEQLKRDMGPEVDYAKEPSEDYASCSITFVDDEGRTVHSDYGGAKAFLATKEAALADLHEGLVPKSAR